MADITVKIDTTDTVGITLQAWLKQYLINNKIAFCEPLNTQEFPDFFLDDVASNQHMLEIKAFNYNATPAFDIANFESYCIQTLKKEDPDHLNQKMLFFRQYIRRLLSTKEKRSLMSGKMYCHGITKTIINVIYHFNIKRRMTSWYIANFFDTNRKTKSEIM